MSKLKSDTARTNGAKSNGPNTDEGKAISSRNSLRHGLRAKAVVLPEESQEEFDELREDYIQRFQPADRVESDLVNTMAVARWRLLRIASIESGILTEGINLAIKFDEDNHLSFSFTRNQDTLASLTRYENSLNRTFDRALKQLQLLQKSRPAPPATTELGFVRQIPKPAPSEAFSIPASEPSNPVEAPLSDSPRPMTQPPLPPALP